ncbi:MAG TPA: Ig-like domain-containing protein [Edaphobacter sp.]
MLRRCGVAVFLSLATFTVSSCGNSANKTGAPTAAVKSLSVSPGSATILMGKQQQFSATATYSDGSTTSAPAGITWTSSNTAVATVDSSGLVKGVAPGNVTISAAVGSVNGSSSTKVQTVLATLDRSTDVAGPDKDGNGVRDDIDQVITGFGLTASQAKALTQFAAALQVAILSSPDKTSAYSNAVELHRGQECVFSQLTADSTKYTKQVKAFTLNTQPRVMAFAGFSHNASGAVYPQPTGTVCK